jgi:hypothetical protein
MYPATNTNTPIATSSSSSFISSPVAPTPCGPYASRTVPDSVHAARPFCMPTLSAASTRACAASRGTQGRRRDTTSGSRPCRARRRQSISAPASLAQSIYLLLMRRLSTLSHECRQSRWANRSEFLFQYIHLSRPAFVKSRKPSSFIHFRM